ncbi:MAG: PhzF family phenazine biosynthesis protein [Spirochaetia bacterium]
MKIPLYQVDAFTSRLFAGNPAAVVFPEEEMAEATMQAIAAENNLAETAFVGKEEEKFSIRWFTPTMEVDLCGHATLASGHVLFRHRNFSGDIIVFSSKSGELRVRREENFLVLDFPADTLDRVERGEAADLVTAALGTGPKELYRGRDDFMAILPSEGDVLSLVPDLTAVASLPSRGLIVTAPGKKADFVSRYFAPQSGIPEDPVTGSAHTTLTPYWADRLGKNTLRALQVSPRGGELACGFLGDRVEIAGNAVTYLIGEIEV